MLTLFTSQEHGRFTQALAEANTVKMLIFGNSPTVASIASKAEIREGALSIRRVIWVQEPQLLSAAEFERYRQGSEEIAVCTINVTGQPVTFLRSKDADSQTALERAFDAAQQQSGK